MKYYLGKGTEFAKEKCKEYKTIEGALKAAAKDEKLVVWDEDGKIIGSLTDDVPEGALQMNTDGSVPVFNEKGNKEGAADVETVEAVTGDMTETEAEETDKEESDKEEPDKEEPEAIIPDGKMRVTVICDGSLNLRRTAEWGNENICGRAIRGQSYYVKELHRVSGKMMVRTIDNLYLSGEPEHVKLEKL